MHFYRAYVKCTRYRVTVITTGLLCLTRIRLVCLFISYGNRYPFWWHCKKRWKTISCEMSFNWKSLQPRTTNHKIFMLSIVCHGRCRRRNHAILVVLLFLLFDIRNKNNTVSRCICDICPSKKHWNWMKRARARKKGKTTRRNGEKNGKDYLSFCIFRYNGFSCQTNILHGRHIAWHQTNIGTDFINVLAY